MEHDVVI